MDARTGWCEGCWRTIDEISQWRTMTNAQRLALWEQLVQRSTDKTPTP